MFSGASSFNQDLDNWNTSNITDMASMFYGASAFNGNIENWDVSYVSYMEYMFYNASSFDRNLGNWNLGAPYMEHMLDNCGMSVANYDNTLIGWLSQSPEYYIDLGAAGLNYCDGETARNTLVNTYNWNITGDALDCPSNCFPPNNVTVEVTTPTNALFSWDVMPEATYYQVKYRLRGTVAWSTSGTANTQRNIPNLIDKKYYQYKVRTQCGVEWSDFSAVQLFYTSTCDVPTGVASIYLDNTRLRIRWDNDPNEIKAKVRYREVGTAIWYTQNSQEGQNFMYINDLTPNATYQYKVRSNCDGNDWSAYTGNYFHDLSAANLRLEQEEVALEATKIYPNPTRDILNIEFETKNAEEVNIIISDNLGKTIHAINGIYNEGIQTKNIDMNRFANGHYFITIRSGERMETQKLMKMN
jgi:surface protein